jgi:hypothetical protein
VDVGRGPPKQILPTVRKEIVSARLSIPNLHITFSLVDGGKLGAPSKNANKKIPAMTATAAISKSETEVTREIQGLVR